MLQPVLSRRLDHSERTSQEPGSASAAHYNIAPRNGTVVNVMEYAGSLADGAVGHRRWHPHGVTDSFESFLVTIRERTASQRNCGDVASALGFKQHQKVLPLRRWQVSVQGGWGQYVAKGLAFGKPKSGKTPQSRAETWVLILS